MDIDKPHTHAQYYEPPLKLKISTRTQSKNTSINSCFINKFFAVWRRLFSFGKFCKFAKICLWWNMLARTFFSIRVSFIAMF